MHAHEFRRVETLLQMLHRLAHEVALPRSMQLDVLPTRDDVLDLRHRHDTQLAAAMSSRSVPCNDIAVAGDGTAYVSESYGGKVHRLKPGATSLELWASDEQMKVIDGLALLADGLYVNDIATGALFRISITADGSAGVLVPIATSIPLRRPDGLRSAGPKTLVQAEQVGRVTELAISGDRAEVRVVQDGLSRAAGVTIVGNALLVLVDFSKAVVVPYALP
jgi:sugar lactone lactonase YvrE